MAILPPPVSQYLSGKLPTHSSTQSLESNFKGLPPGFLLSILEQQGLVADGKPVRRAVEEGFIDVCAKDALWNLDKVSALLAKGGLKPVRAYANQKLPPIEPTPRFGSLTTVSTYFNVSEIQVGRWLDELGLRDNKEPTKDVIKSGLAQVIVMPGKKNKGRSYVQWEVPRTVKVLHDAGHPLDFDFQKSLKGKGKNSNVEVTTVDGRVKEFLEEFIPLFNARDVKVKTLVAKTPTGIKARAEERLGKPGFFSQKHWEQTFK